MPRYEVRLGRTSRIYERAYVTVEADDEYHAGALAYNIGVENDADEVSWDVRDSDLFSETDVEVEAWREVKDDRP
jgi:1,2-phenylacetyl-CoA epoxidase PaaB subunit